MSNVGNYIINVVLTDCIQISFTIEMGEPVAHGLSFGTCQWCCNIV